MYQGKSQAEIAYIQRQKLVQERIQNDDHFKLTITRAANRHAALAFGQCFSWLKKIEMKQDRLLICFELEGKQVRINWERIKQYNVLDFEKWIELKNKPFCLEKRLNGDIFQLDYSMIENLFQSVAGPPHANQKAHLKRQVEADT